MYLPLMADRSILFEFTGCMHLADCFETLDEVHPALTASFVVVGPHIAEREPKWVLDMGNLIGELVGQGTKVGIERMNAKAAIAMREAGFVSYFVHELALLKIAWGISGR